MKREVDTVLDSMLEELKEKREGYFNIRNMPRIGEYWYVNENSDIYLCKIIGYCSVTKRIIVKIEEDFNTIDGITLRYKWKPNWFWRVMGYV